MQQEMHILSAVPALDLVDRDLILRCQSMQEALAVSRAMGRRKLSDAGLADAVGVCPSVWSRIQNKPKERPAYMPEDRYAALCEALGNVGIIQWLASRVGYDVVPMAETREQKLRRELAEIEQARSAAA